uniref:Uncharacterized protein n=2 Tax=Acrobeloides nanus TaxID=290746 RepID=A0A914CW01_9BILA
MTLLYFSVNFIQAGKIYMARAYGGETNWEDHHALMQKTTMPSEPNVFQTAWDDSLASISSGWEQVKSGFNVVTESVADFFSAAPKKVGGAIGTGLGEMLEGLLETMLGGTFVVVKFILILIAVFLFFFILYISIKKHCCAA